MEFAEVVRRRRMVRNYRDEPVDPAVLERIVRAGLRAPSAGYSQGQRFIVVTDPELRKAVADASGEPEYVAAGFEPWISRAPALIVVCVHEDAYHARYREPDKLVDGREIKWPVPYWYVDAGAALVLVLLAAVAEGLAAGFAGGHSFVDLKKVLGVPDGAHAIGVVTIGHPAPDRRSSSLDRGRNAFEEVVYRERWGRTEV